MSRLLHKPLRLFALYALIILVCSIPVYYSIVDSIWMEELDEHNRMERYQLITGFEALDQNEEEFEKSITLWNQIRSSASIIAVSGTGLRQDSVYSIRREILEDGERELENFRGLRSFARIKGRIYKVSIETNVEEAEDTVMAIALVTCLFIGLLITGFILLNKWLSARIWRPFYDTIEKLQRFSLDAQQNITFRETGILEFKALNEALTKLIDGNVKAFRQQKEFSQNASHELQTPLALIKSKIDLLIQDPALTKEQRLIIDALNHSLSRISRINKNLLLLSKLENQSYPDTLIDLGAVVGSAVQMLEEHLSGKNLSIEMDLQKNVSIRANESLLEILINNLLLNALRHNITGGHIVVLLKEGLLIISNPGTKPLNSEQLFRRFSAASPEMPSSGLGLAIVKEICDRNRWQISYAFENSLHIFTFRF